MVIGMSSVAFVHRAHGHAGDSGCQRSDPGHGRVSDAGLRGRTTDQSSLYAHALNVRGLSTEGDERVDRKVGIEFKAAQAQWGVDSGGLGLHISGMHA